MPNRPLLPPFYLIALLLVALLACSDSSTSPDDDSPAAFSRILHADGNDGVSATDLVVTSDGTRVVSGGFDGTMHVTGWADSLVDSSNGDLFVVAFEPEGRVAWARAVGGDAHEVSTSSARDGSDNIYLGGSYFGNTVIGPSSLQGYGGTDAMVVKLDPNGDPLWAVGGGAALSDFVHDIVVSPSGEVYACGRASSEIVIAGEDMGEFSGVSGFLVSIHSNGVGAWAATAYGSGEAECRAVARANDGDVVVSGTYTGSPVEIGGEILPVDANDVFVARYSAAGDAVWAIRIGGTGYTGVSAITAIDNDVVIAGSLSGTEDFSDGAAGGEVTSAGGYDGVIARYAADGSLKWVRQFGTNDVEFINDVCRFGTGGLLVAGSFDDVLVLGSQTLQTNGGQDHFVARLDGSGNVISASKIGGPNHEPQYAAVAVAGTSTIILGPVMSGDIRFPDGSTRSSQIFDAFIYQQP